jgi:hypothetical protein
MFQGELVNMKVLSRDEKLEGRATGSYRYCQLEGCPGLRIAVRWPDGKLTWPCDEGLTTNLKYQVKII